ncbi:uncharacterized protein LOC110851801 [Folsomia candida]|uniref:uncharacterized protein LOC110851801 n=1 Tax=Folsomia candida TaxID=158441 RepID=UPI000B908324|nr:uncharacterized protein LOC110851801 [Folsomia candida]
MLFLSEKFWFYFIASCIYNTASADVSEKPTLALQQDWPESDWKFLISDGSQQVFSQNKSTFILNCSAPYPIQWKIEGTIEPPEFVKIQPYRRTTNRNSESFLLQIIIFFTSIENSFSSATISCEKIGSPEIVSKYDVFVPSDETTLLLSKTLERISSNFLVPCSTTNPTVPVTLHRVKDNGELVKVEGGNLRYVESKGFLSSKALEGKFVCTAKNSNGTKSSVTFTIPNSSIIGEAKGFIGEDIEVFCPTPNYTVTSANNSRLFDQVKVLQIYSGYKILIPARASGKGILKCGVIASGNVPQTWNFEILGHAPELYLDNYEGEVDCLSEYSDRSVATVRCRDPSDCEYMKHCFADPQSCNYRRQKQFHSQFPGRCWVQEKNKGADCASVPYYHLNGIVQCGSGEHAIKRFLFFVGLDYRRYSNWKEAPKNALIRLGHEVNVRNKTEFVCEAVSFLFADSLRFSIKFENGTEVFLESSDANQGSSLYSHRKTRDEFNVVRVLEKMEPFPSNVISLKCHAPWWNSTEWITSEIKLPTGENNCL